MDHPEDHSLIGLGLPGHTCMQVIPLFWCVEGLE